MMKHRILAIGLAIVMAVGSSMTVIAAPSDEQLSDSRQKYAEIESKINGIEDKIYELNSQMEQLQSTIEKNKSKIENINKVTENTKKDIVQCKKEISDLDLALGERVKQMYNSGNLEFNYLSFILEADSSTEMLSRVQAVTNIVGKDKEAIEKIDDKKEELNNKIKSLSDQKDQISNLNKEVQDNLSEISGKKKEQETLANDAKKEKSKFDAEYLSKLEREAVQAQFDVIDNSGSSSSDIEGAINQLTSIKNSQIKSPIVSKEISDKIEKGKNLAAQKKEAEKASQIAAAKASAASAASEKSSTSSKKSNSSAAVPSGGNAQAILNEAYKHLGKPYVWGATGPSNFDCSGFTQYVYQHAAGIDISRTTYTQINVGQPVSQSELRPGDLVFPHAGHVGIYVGNGQMIHAPQTGDVIKVGPVYNFYAARRIL